MGDARRRSGGSVGGGGGGGGVRTGEGGRAVEMYLCVAFK